MTTTLTCMRVGKAGRTFTVKFAKSELIGELKKAIKEARSNELKKIDASDLKLYLAKRGGVWLKDNNSDDTIKQLKGGDITGDIDDMCKEENEMESSWSLQEWLDEYKMPEPTTKEIHVLVQLPSEETASSDAAASERLMPPVDKGWSDKWLEKFRSTQVKSHNLPLLTSLAGFIETPLDFKINVHQQLFNEWKSQPGGASSELLSKIFKIDNDAPCVNLFYKVIQPIVDTVRPGRTENSFHAFWDSLIRHVLDFTLPNVGMSDRDSNQSTSTGLKRPDYIYIVNSVCVFRGEEKDASQTVEIPRRELCDKLIWIYGNVPYLFGYAAAGFNVRLYAITCANPSGAVGEAKTEDLGGFDLTKIVGRLRLLLAILNIARLFQGIADMCPASGRNEYETIVRSNNIEVVLEPTRVLKCFPDMELFEKSRKVLEPLYALMENNRVPNTDELVKMNLSKKRMVFEPRGTDMKPSSLEDLFRVLRDILLALVKLHALSWMHRDIRWTNVIKRRDGSDSWFLIDFMDAAHSPQKSPSGRHLSRKEHAPEIFDSESHNTAVDMWSLGYLIETSGDEVHQDWYDKGGERTKLVERLLHSDPSQRPSAAEALEIVKQLEEQYLSRKKRKIEVQ